MPAAADLALRPLVSKILDARYRSDELFRIVRPDSIYERPIPERHRIIFYLGHLEAFDWNLLHENVFGLRSFDPQFDRLFAFGIDPVGGGLPSDRPADWPTPESVHEYVRKIRAALDEKLNDLSLLREDVPLSAGFGHTGGEHSLDLMLNVAIEHRLMHIETLAYMLHQLRLDRKIPHSDPPRSISSPVLHRSVEIPAGVATLGLPRDADIFGWDNEFESHTVSVPNFEIDRYMVTNREYLDFIAAGGYEHRAFWVEEDWKWKATQEIRHPVFWKRSDDQWLYRTMFREIPLPLDWPVYVSHAEAEAYARWAGRSLPTEAEWQRAAYGTVSREERFYPWGNRTPKSTLGNFDFQRWDPSPVHSFPESCSAFGAEGMLGNGWEWTSTVFSPFAGFQKFSFYPGYSADFFDGQHFVLKGGSARTAACMLRPTFRNWFQAHYQFVYAGFRCVNR